MTAQGCRICGAYGEGIESQPPRYDKPRRVVWRSYEVTHRNGLTHRYESTNLPQDDRRFEWRPLKEDQ